MRRSTALRIHPLETYFPSFLEGLSLRQSRRGLQTHPPAGFPFLFGRAFIEAGRLVFAKRKDGLFPFLFGRAFIEAGELAGWIGGRQDFPSFLEGLSLRPNRTVSLELTVSEDFPSFLEGLSLRRAGVL